MRLRLLPRAPDWATHRGWFGLCPVWLSDVDSEGPVVEPRWSAIAWLMPISSAIYGLCIAVRSAFDPGYVPSWPILISGPAEES